MQLGLGPLDDNRAKVRKTFLQKAPKIVALLGIVAIVIVGVVMLAHFGCF